MDQLSTRADIDNIAVALGALADKIEANGIWDMQDANVRADHDRIVTLLDHAADTLDAFDLSALMARVSLREQLIALNARLHSVTEYALARRAVAGASKEDPFEGSWINRGFTDLLAGQIIQWQRCGALATDHTRIAIVGGGALPQTQAYLARKLGCETISIERDVEAVELSREVLARARITNALVVAADGCLHDFSGCSIVVVATLVQRKLAVADQIARTAPYATFAPRTATGAHAMWREPVVAAEVASNGWDLLDVWAPLGSTVASHAYRQRAI